MSAHLLTFTSAGVAEIHYARCEPCQFGQHSGGWHSWAGSEDITHAIATGQPDPSDKRCGCDCATQPAVEQDFDDESPVVSLNADPCIECGESGACGYDAEGRAMIHVTESEDD